MIWGRIKRIFISEFPSKVNEESIPFQPQEREKMIMFKCKKCEFEEEVPDFVPFSLSFVILSSSENENLTLSLYKGAKLFIIFLAISPREFLFVIINICLVLG